MKLLRNDHIALYVSDIKKSSAWYRKVLKVKPAHVEDWWSDDFHFFASGDAQIALLRKPDGETYESRGMPASNHSAFRVTKEDFEAYKKHLKELKIPFRQSDHGIAMSVYFQDPDDYWIELTCYDE